MDAVLVLHHGDDIPLGLLGEALEIAAVPVWRMEAERPLLEAAGVDPEDLVAEVRHGERAQREMAARLFGAWAEEVVASSQWAVGGLPNA